jgi:hypothetical protein
MKTPDDNDELTTDQLFQLSSSSLAEDWNSAEDEIWDE